jgi:hypothetical protein
MRRLRWDRGLPLILILVTCISLRAQTGNPFFSVISYGAKCDGATNDTAAFAAALTAANNQGGGEVFVPSTVTGACVIAGQLVLDGFSGVSLSGPPGGNAGLRPSVGNPGVNPHPTLLFTGTSSPLLSMRSSKGIAIRNLTLQYNNAAFTGTFIDLSHGTSGADSDMDSIADSTIQGTSSGTVVANQANPLVSLDKAINVTIERNIFEWALNGIVGPETASSYSNVIRIRDNLFGGYGTNPISGNMILNLGSAWIVEGNTFEMGGTSASAPIPINANSVGCAGGCSIIGNWFGDVQPQYTGALITGAFPGTSLQGNLISGAASTRVTGILLGGIAGCSSGTSITGNAFQSLATAINFASSCSAVFVSGNQYTSVTAFSSGSPSSGIVTDNSGATHIYGNLIKPAGSFQIDDPLDPANEYLTHSFVESPDMMNIYNGVATLDARGKALVKLPQYFEALNRDFRYQLTCVGGASPIYVAREISNNQFVIAGGKPGLKVSWQVTGIRHDDYANSHRIEVEEEKPAGEKGHYLYPAIPKSSAREAARPQAALEKPACEKPGSKE